MCGLFWQLIFKKECVPFRGTGSGSSCPGQRDSCLSHASNGLATPYSLTRCYVSGVEKPSQTEKAPRPPQIEFTNDKQLLQVMV